jgi:hypothetical protein
MLRLQFSYLERQTKTKSKESTPPMPPESAPYKNIYVLTDSLTTESFAELARMLTPAAAVESKAVNKMPPPTPPVPERRHPKIFILTSLIRRRHLKTSQPPPTRLLLYPLLFQLIRRYMQISVNGSLLLLPLANPLTLSLSLVKN